MPTQEQLGVRGDRGLAFRVREVGILEELGRVRRGGRARLGGLFTPLAFVASHIAFSTALRSLAWLDRAHKIVSPSP